MEEAEMKDCFGSPERIWAIFNGQLRLIFNGNLLR